MFKNKIILKLFLIFVLLFALIISLFLFLSKVVFTNEEYAYLIATCSYDFAIFIIVVFTLSIWKMNFFSFFKPISLKEFFFSAFIALLLVFLYPLFKVPNFLNNLIESKILTLEVSSYSPVITQKHYPQFYGLFRTVVLAPFFEELFFRGVVLNKVKEKYSAIVAILFSSILFAIYHMDFEQAIIAFFAGLIYGYIYIKKDNLSIVVLIHLLNNLAFFFLKDKLIDANGWNILYYCIYPIGLLLLYIAIQKLTKLSFFKA